MENMDYIRKEKELLEKIDELCDSYELPKEIFEKLITDDINVLKKHKLKKILDNFYIMNRFYTLSDIYDHLDFLLMNSKELYIKINVLLSNKMSLKKIFNLDFEGDKYLRHEFLKIKFSDEYNVDEKLIDKYKFVYRVSKNNREKELEELEHHIEKSSNNKTNNKKVSSIYELFSHYSKEEIDYVISTLCKLDKEVINAAYGDDLSNPVRGDLWKYAYIRSDFKEVIALINKRLEKNRLRKNHLKITNFYDYFKDFSEDEVNTVIFSLNEKDVEFFKTAFGDDLRHIKKDKKWTKKDSKYFKDFMFRFLKELFNNRKKMESGEIDISITYNNRLDNDNSCNTFNEYLNTFSYKELEEMLGSVNAIIVTMKLALHISRNFKEVEIAKYLKAQGERITTKEVQDMYKNSMAILNEKYKSYKFKDELIKKKN